MLNKIKFNKVSMIAFVSAVTVLGGGIMTVTNLSSNTAHAETEKQAIVADVSVPGAGMGDVIDDYVGATTGSSVELLSSTALGASLDITYNPYYDENGNTIGKFIVYTGEQPAEVYDVIPGNERIETGAAPAQITGHIYYGDVATFAGEQGDWYQIISDYVNGYVRKDFFAKGVEAENLDGITYENAVYAYYNGVPMYADDQKTLICMLPDGVRYTLVEYGDPLSKINVNGIGEGWVNNLDVNIFTARKFATTVSYEEEATARLLEGIAAAETKEEEAALEEAARAAEEAGSQQAANYIRNSINIAPQAPDSADTAALRQAIANYAQQFVGVLPYIWASSDLSYGADCSGFTSAIYRAYGIEISRSSDAQAWEGTSVSVDDIRPGDIIAYPGHVALYIGDGTIVHETNPGTTASYADMYCMPIINIVRYIN